MLTVNSAQYADVGFYQVSVTNIWGSVHSVSVSLLLITAPSIGTAPQSQSVGIGGMVTFNVSAGGTAPDSTRV